MNDDHLLENEIRKIRPSPLPDDLRKRMASEPTPIKHSPPRRLIPWAVAAGLAAAACTAILVNLPRSTDMIAETNPNSSEVLSIVEQETTLMDARTVGFREHNGRMWELVDQEWRDNTVAICSSAPVRVRSTVDRPETVWIPVNFQ